MGVLQEEEYEQPSVYRDGYGRNNSKRAGLGPRVASVAPGRGRIHHCLMWRDPAMCVRGVDAPNSPLIASEKMAKSQNCLK